MKQGAARAGRGSAVISRSIAALGVSAALGAALLVTTTPQVASATTVHNNGEWPGVGKICGSGPGGPASARGVTKNSIDITAFNDANNTVQPGLDIELLQAGQAFAAWCNASGGIDGRKIVVKDRDGGIFNDAQVTEEACQSDFMAVGGGLVLDQPTVPIRTHCGLGQISQFTVSNQAEDAALQVNPANISLTKEEGGFYGALAKKYPAAVKHFGDGAPNQASIIAPITKWKDSAVDQGYKLVDWQLPPLQATDWGPYIQQLESKGVQALEPANYSNMVPYMQAMSTAGYKPAFIVMPGPLYVQSTAAAAAADSNLPPTYIGISSWPFELASESPGLEQLIAIMKKDGSNGSKLDFDDEDAFDAWNPLREVRQCVRCQPDRLVRVEERRFADELDGRRIGASGGPPGHVQREADPIRLLGHHERRAEQIRLQQDDHPTEHRHHLALRPQVTLHGAAERLTGHRLLVPGLTGADMR